MTHILPSLQHRESLHFNTQPGICRPHLNTQDTITAVVHVQRHNFETPAQNSLAHAVFSAVIGEKLAKRAEKRNFEKRLRPN